MRQFGLLCWAETRTLPLLFQEFHFPMTKQKLCNKAHSTPKGSENQGFLPCVSFIQHNKGSISPFCVNRCYGLSRWTPPSDHLHRPWYHFLKYQLWAAKPSENPTNKNILNAVFIFLKESRYIMFTYRFSYYRSRAPFFHVATVIALPPFKNKPILQ